MKFITFAAGNPICVKQATNLINSVINYETILYGEDFLKQCEDFWPLHKDFIKNNARGYGYWLWKPFVIQHTMKSMAEGELLFYCDSDFIFQENNFNNILKEIKNKKIITCLTKGQEKELKWNKKDTINRVGVTIVEDDIQVQAGTLLLFICKETKALVDEWYAICCENGYKYLDDTPSTEPNHSSFREHRHDQSIFSLLLKKHNIPYGTGLRSVLLQQNTTAINRTVRGRTRNRRR
jgi:hypothetical protein